MLATPSDITLSPNGVILITGNERHYDSKTGTEISKLLLQKIDKDGTTIWVKKMKEVVGNSGCFDNDNNIIVAGASNTDNIYQTQKPMILKFDRGGHLLWSNVYDEQHKNGRFNFVECDLVIIFM
jgi:hypothetical protein